MVDVIETERLTLRPRTEADLEANLMMDLDPEVHRLSSVPRQPLQSIGQRS